MVLAKLERHLTPFFVYTLFAKSDFTRSLFIIYLVERGLSHGQIGALQAAMFLGSLVVEIPSGVLADMIGRKRVIILGHACLIGVGVGFLTASTFWPFLLIFLLWGVGNSNLSGAEEALLYETVARKDSRAAFTRVLGWVRALSSLALAGSFFVGGQLRSYGWAAVYLAFIISKALAALVILFIPETSPARALSETTQTARPRVPVLEMSPARTPLSEPISVSPEPSETAGSVSLKELVRYLTGAGRALILPIIAVALLDAAVTPFYIFGQEMFRADGLSLGSIGMAYAVMEILASASCLLGNRLKKLVSLSQSLWASLLAVGMILVLTSIIKGPLPGVIFVAAAVTIPQGVYVMFESYLQDASPPHLRASTFSVYSFAVFATVSGAYLGYGMAIERFGIRNADLFLASLIALGIITTAVAFSTKNASPFVKGQA